jgi:hypothetical protein
MTTLFNVDSCYKELPNLTRVLSSIIVMANSADKALLLVHRHSSEALAAGAGRRFVDASPVVIEKKHSRQFYC